MNIVQLSMWMAMVACLALSGCGGAEQVPTNATGEEQLEQGDDLAETPAPETSEVPPAPDSPDGTPSPDLNPVDKAAAAKSPNGDLSPAASATQPGQPGQAGPELAPGTAPAVPATTDQDSGAVGTPDAPTQTQLSEAQKTYRRYASSSASTVLEDGRRLVAEGNFFDARQRFQSATDADPNSASAWYNLGFVQFRSNNFDEAIASLNKAIELNPTYSKAVTLLAIVQLRQGNLSASEQTIEMALSRRPADVMLRVTKAQIQVARKRYAAAVATCITALKLDYDNPEVLRTMAAAYVSLNRPGLAKLALNKAFSIYTKPPEEELGPKPEAQVANPATQYMSRTQRGSDGLRGTGAESIDKSAGLAHIYYLFGRMAMGKGRSVEARKHLLKSVEYRPNYPEAWNNLGVNWLLAKKGEEAIKSFTKSLELEPMFFEARVNLGNAYRISRREDRVEQAKRHYEKARQQDPNHPAPWFNLAILYLENKKLASVSEGADEEQKAIAQVKRFKKAIQLFGEYRNRIGRVSKDDPLNNYITECKNNIKIFEDTRKAAIENAKEQEEERKRLEEERKQKEVEDAAKKAAEDAKKAEEAANQPAEQPAAPTEDAQPNAPSADGDGSGGPSTPPSSPTPPSDGGGSPSAPPAPPSDGGGSPPAPPAPPSDDASPPAPPSKDDGNKDDSPAPPPVPDNNAPPPPPPGGDEPPPQPPPPGRS